MPHQFGHLALIGQHGGPVPPVRLLAEVLCECSVPQRTFFFLQIEPRRTLGYLPVVEGHHVAPRCSTLIQIGFKIQK